MRDSWNWFFANIWLWAEIYVTLGGTLYSMQVRYAVLERAAFCSHLVLDSNCSVHTFCLFWHTWRKLSLQQVGLTFSWVTFTVIKTCWYKWEKCRNWWILQAVQLKAKATSLNAIFCFISFNFGTVQTNFCLKYSHA